MRDYRKLKIWNESMDYVVAVYKFSKILPKSEEYNLISQIKRAATSIPLNISEGAGCGTNKEFQQFLWYAYRSTNEVLTCLELSLRLNFCQRKQVEALSDWGDKICGMIYSFVKKLD
ncbi:four helix bundle protein [candidate division KSB1 bacterium]|nr:four helix bundle protein [candidate division KSB1 bacterium]